MDAAQIVESLLEAKVTKREEIRLRNLAAIDPHAAAVEQAGGKLIRVPLNRAKFNATLSAYAPGCGSPVYPYGPDGGSHPCGARVDGRQEFCPHCTAQTVESLLEGGWMSRWLPKRLQKKEDNTVFLPPGASVTRNDSQRMEISHDPQLFQWWTYDRLPGWFIYPTKHLGRGQYWCKVLCRGDDGKAEEREFELPFDNWKRSEKPVFESIAVDLDGTLAKDTGWKGTDHIGEPIPAMVKLVKDLLDDGEEVVIFTARAHDGKASTKDYIKQWLKDNDLPDLEITNEKRPDMEKFYDDKAVAVEKNSGEVKESVLLESPRLPTLKAKRRSLSAQERRQAGKARVWKAVVNGETWYVSNTHRAYAADRTLKAAIKNYFKVVEPSG